MSSTLNLYNTKSGQLEEFKPINEGFIGMYLCGPTVYGEPHLGHSRGAIFTDVLFRYFQHLGNKVRYVRNITDVGHLLNDDDEGEDKIGKKALLEQIQPMEVAQKYTNSYHKVLNELNCLPPSIEPRASGHIIEQIDFIKQLIESEYAYIINESVYFDVRKYEKNYPYGELSGRKLDQLQAGAGNERRELSAQNEKKNPEDFALWKKADPQHIMRWQSPWGIGFPGWHIECSVMSTKYLGQPFDIHIGGLDLLFPHHECELAQCKAINGKEQANYWLHNNMITINGQKMAKSLNNGILIEELFSGNNPLLEQAYSPMTLRFFILMAHYRSTLDFSNDALKAAQNGLKRLLKAYETLQSIETEQKDSLDFGAIETELRNHLNDDLNTAKAIATFFDFAKNINKIQAKGLTITKAGKKRALAIFENYLFGILGIKEDIKSSDNNNQMNEKLIELFIEQRQIAKINKDYQTSDQIRDKLAQLGIILKDHKDGATFEIIN